MEVRRWIGRSVFLIFVISTAVFPTVFRGTAAGAKDQRPRIPDVIQSGLNDYGFKGAEVAVKEWVKGSALEGTPDALSQVNILRQAESIYGGFLGYHSSGTCTEPFLSGDLHEPELRSRLNVRPIPCLPCQGGMDPAGSCPEYQTGRGFS